MATSLPCVQRWVLKILVHCGGSSRYSISDATCCLFSVFDRLAQLAFSLSSGVDDVVDETEIRIIETGPDLLQAFNENSIRIVHYNQSCGIRDCGSLVHVLFYQIVGPVLLIFPVGDG